MGQKIRGEKVFVRKAKEKELEYLYKNKDFSEQYNVPESSLRKEWPCFVIVKNKEIIGYRYFEFHEVNGKKHAWVGKTSLKKGYEGKGFGKYLVGRANQMVHALKFNELRTHAYNIRAKKFWKRMGFERVSGKKMSEKGNTQLKLDLKKQRAKK